MKISKAQIQHIAHLARIGLTKDEIEIYSRQLSQILKYMEILNEIDTKNIPITAQVTGLENITRQDLVSDCTQETKEAIIRQFPQKQGNLLKVKTILS